MPESIDYIDYGFSICLWALEDILFLELKSAKLDCY